MASLVGMNLRSEPAAAAALQPADTARVRELFDQLLDLAPAARPDWLQAQVPEPGLRAEIERLLAGHERMGALDLPSIERMARIGSGAEYAAEGFIGRVIGAYTLQRLLGRGGMGVVFLGEREDEGVRRQAAIKLLHRGLLNPVEQRLFRRERQLLATLSHPNIAQLIDGGVAEPGIPYLVLEYVDGVSISEHVQARALDLNARLALFATVCRTVAAAHRQLIVHRDLKPSNILVDGEGRVKLLDFGIAKLLDEDPGEATRTAFAAMTPEYAAPEQLAHGPVSTATDVYSLGVLLHELLLGARPAAADPVKPSTQASSETLRRQLRGDLDDILRVALAAEPERRYPSALEFAEDLERHLAALPVRAHPPSRRYRAQKFVQRHRGAVVATMAFVLAVFASLGIALWQARVAHQESGRAQAQASRADSVRGFLESLFEPVDRGLPQAQQPTVAALVATGVERLRAEPQMAPGERVDLLMMFARLNDRIGEPRVARTLGIEAAELAHAALPAGHAARTDSLALRGAQSVRAGDYDAGEADLREAQAQLAQAGRGGAPLIAVLDALAVSRMDRNDHLQALALERAALAERIRSYGEAASELAAGYNNLGYGLVGAGRFDEAAEAYQRSYELDQKYRDPGTEGALGTLSNWGWALARAGRIAPARDLLAKADEGFAQLGGQVRFLQVLNAQKRCRLDAAFGTPAEAGAACERMLAATRAYTGGSGMFWGYALQLEAAHRIETGELDQAQAQVAAALEQHPESPEHARGRGGALQLRATLAWLTGDAMAARRDAEAAAALFADIGDADVALLVLQALELRACEALPDPACKAGMTMQFGGRLAAQAGSDDPRLLGPRLWWATRNRPNPGEAGALPAIDAAIASAARQLDPQHPMLATAAVWRALAMAQGGDCAAATTAVAEALQAATATGRGAYPWLLDATATFERKAGCPP